MSYCLFGSLSLFQLIKSIVPKAQLIIFPTHPVRFDGNLGVILDIFFSFTFCPIPCQLLIYFKNVSPFKPVYFLPSPCPTCQHELVASLTWTPETAVSLLSPVSHLLLSIHSPPISQSNLKTQILSYLHPAYNLQ